MCSLLDMLTACIYIVITTKCGYGLFHSYTHCLKASAMIIIFEGSLMIIYISLKMYRPSVVLKPRLAQS